VITLEPSLLLALEMMNRLDWEGLGMYKGRVGTGVKQNLVHPKGLFTRREGYPSKRVNPGWRAKDSPRLQAKFYR